MCQRINQTRPKGATAAEKWKYCKGWAEEQFDKSDPDEEERWSPDQENQRKEPKTSSLGTVFEDQLKGAVIQRQF